MFEGEGGGDRVLKSYYVTVCSVFKSRLGSIQEVNLVPKRIGIFNLLPELKWD